MCCRYRGKVEAVKALHRGRIYMEIPYAFGEMCFSPRSLSFQEVGDGGYMGGFTRTTYINTTRSNQLLETSLASLLRKLLPPPYPVPVPLPCSSSFFSRFLPSQREDSLLLRSRCLFYLNRSELRNP